MEWSCTHAIQDQRWWWWWRWRDDGWRRRSFKLWYVCCFLLLLIIRLQCCTASQLCFLLCSSLLPVRCFECGCVILPLTYRSIRRGSVRIAIAPTTSPATPTDHSLLRAASSFIDAPAGAATAAVATQFDASSSDGFALYSVTFTFAFEYELRCS